ncbi:MAG: hypothetical protein NTY09_05630 [bacterium]|nr:hypothetical protein [bacterium]
MVELHEGTTGELISRVLSTSSDPVTLIITNLPDIPVLNQIAITAGQRSREFRIITSLYRSGPHSTLRQVESLIHLIKIGAKIRIADRGELPSLLSSPPTAAVILPSDWGWGKARWQCPVIIEGDSAAGLFALADKIWRRAGSWLSSRKLRTTRRWLEDIVPGIATGETGENEPYEIDLSTLSLFDKRRGSKKRKPRREHASWWSFHGTADDRINPFLPVHIWASKRDAYKVIRFPSGKRPTGVRTGDDIFFVLLSREPGGDNESHVAGCAKAVKYRDLIDDATDEQRGMDTYLDRYPHGLRLENAAFISGAVGEGIPISVLMDKLGPETFSSTTKNRARGSGNTDPVKSIAQKSIIQLSEKGAKLTHELLEDRMNRIGRITAGEIAGYE